MVIFKLSPRFWEVIFIVNILQFRYLYLIFFLILLSMRMESARRRQQMRRQDRTWTSLQRRHLHPHYAVSILDDTVNRQSDGLQGAINRAIAGAFMGTGEAAVANNIVNLTHRIQRWDFRKCDIPDVSDGEFTNILPSLAFWYIYINIFI